MAARRTYEQQIHAVCLALGIAVSPQMTLPDARIVYAATSHVGKEAYPVHWIVETVRNAYYKRRLGLFERRVDPSIPSNQPGHSAFIARCLHDKPSSGGKVRCRLA